MNHAMPTNFYAKSIYELVIYLKFYQDGSKKKRDDSRKNFQMYRRRMEKSRIDKRMNRKEGEIKS